MRAAIIASVVVHALAIAAAATHEAPEHDPAWLALVTPPAPPAPPSRGVAIDEPVLEVIWLGELDAPAPVAPPREATPARVPRPRAVATTTAASGRELDRPAEPSLPAEPAVDPGAPARPSLLSMRRPSANPLALPQDFVDELAARDVRAEIPDVPGARIDAEIAAILERRRNGTDYMEELGALVALREQKRQLELVPQRDGTYRTEKRRFIATVGKDGKMKITDKPNVEVVILPFGIAGTFDLTEAMMRRYRMDPYAAEKLALLDRTRDQRFALAQVHRTEQLAFAREYAAAAVDRAWAQPALADKKRALFELWDDCAETGDAALVDAGRRARAYIVNFIQWKLTGAEAYTADELRALNARRTSRQVFAPYE